MKLLVSAFEPFAGARTNSSLILAKELEKQNWNGQVDFHFPIPVTYKNAWQNLLMKIQTDGPYDAVLALGQSESRSKISLERIALNWIDARIADNQGTQIMNQKIKSGSEVLWSTIPWENFELPSNCERSYSAGTFVCNHLMYELLCWNQNQGLKASFIHVPLIHGQENDFPSKTTQSLDDLLESMKKIISFVLSLK